MSATPAGHLLLSWLAPAGSDTWALQVTARHDGRWLEPTVVARQGNFFVNWADFPSIVETSTGAWLVHWLQKTEAKPYAYDVMLASSTDRGTNWTTPQRVHADRSPTEHGFVSMVPGSDGSVAIAWLDGRAMADGGSMSLRFATWYPGGGVRRETVIDPRTCECCQVAMARSSTGLVAAYRDRSEEEIRDIAVVRQVGSQWMPPVIVHQDGFVTRACPVNGPAIDASQQEVVVAWFTAPNDQLRVRAAFSHTGGASFERPTQVDLGNTIGRVQTRLIGPGTAAVVWLEATSTGAEWKARRVTSGGRAGRPLTLGATSRSRDAGFARVVLVGNQLYAAWSEPGPEGRVRVVRFPVASLAR